MLLTVASTARVLDRYSIDAPEWGPTEMSAALGMSKSKAHSLLASMAESGLLRRSPRGRYRLGWRLLALNRVLADTTEFRCFARPVMEVLCAHFGETAHLGVIDDGQVLYVDRSHGRNAVSLPVSEIGMRMPAHCTAVGKMLLSQLDEPTLDALILEHGLPARTRNSIDDAGDLRAELAHIWQRELAFDREEAISDICCVAAPIRNIDGSAVAAISITAPTHRFNANERCFEIAIRRAAKLVSRRLRDSAHAAAELDVSLH